MSVFCGIPIEGEHILTIRCWWSPQCWVVAGFGRCNLENNTIFISNFSPMVSLLPSSLGNELMCGIFLERLKHTEEMLLFNLCSSLCMSHRQRNRRNTWKSLFWMKWCFKDAFTSLSLPCQKQLYANWTLFNQSRPISFDGTSFLVAFSGSQCSCFHGGILLPALFSFWNAILSSKSVQKMLLKKIKASNFL